MFDPSKAEHVYIAIGYTNMRMGIDGLVKTIRETFHENPQTNSLFLFCGRKKDRIKGLYLYNNRYLLLYKRLENGKYKWPRTESELKELTPQQFRWLLEGLNIFANTPKGAYSSAVIFSIIETAKENGLDPYRYPVWVLKTAPTLKMNNPQQVDLLLLANAPSHYLTGK